MTQDDFFVDKVLDGLSDRLRMFAESVRVVGDPIRHEDTIIIPVITVSTGFAGGGGGGQSGEETKGAGSAGGGGGGIRINPKGFLVIRNDEVKLLSFGGKSRVESVANVLPEILEKVKGLREDDRGE